MVWSRAQLAGETCATITKHAARLAWPEINALLTALPEWSVVNRDGADWVEREFHFPDFRTALDFVVRVGALAEEQNHHPMLRLTWGRVLVSWRTIQLRGFHRNDFIMAAKTDALWDALD